MTIELGDGVKMEFILIPTGSFRMGSDKRPDTKPMHRVEFTKPFYMGKYEVTQEQWEKVMGNNPSRFKDTKNPVDSVSWDDCQKFIAKLKEKMRGQTFRLPSEAEWEYACRAGSITDYCYGDKKDKLGDYAWFKDNSGQSSHPVGQKKPNRWGLYDMHGNVSEWCQDAWHDTYKGAPTDGSAWIQAGALDGVHRGGHLTCLSGYLHSDYRYRYPHGARSSALGLRLVAVVGTP
ncbi:MAG: formylglycine-generating enzyme family protein [Verrucomicrobia bacterium]|nr:formylglycine-generating enzyme family protein [Verrucomicrobiota bacterium]